MSSPHFDWIAHHARRTPDKIAVEDTAAPLTKTYREFDRRIAQLAAALREAHGIGRGDRVAVLAHNCSELFEIQFACGRLGAIFAPLNVRLALPEISAIIADLEPSLIICEVGEEEVARDLGRMNGGIAISLLGVTNDLELLIADHTPIVSHEPLTHDDISTIIYTSGTTGVAKGVLITHGMTFWHAINMTAPARVCPNAVGLVVLPLCHSAGLNLYANPIFHNGGTVKMTRSFDPGETLQLLSDDIRPVTHVFGVPTIYQMLADHSDFHTARLDRLTTAGIGGAPASPALLDIWQRRGRPLQQGYGMTEAGPSILVIDQEDCVRKAGSVGKGLIHNELRVVDDDGREVKGGESGELQVRGPSMTPGYWRRPDARDLLFDGDWLRTRDVVQVDDEGFFHIIGRRKDIFISGGINIHPAEIEGVLCRHPDIAEAAVVGVPHKTWGEVGVAFIVLRDGSSVAESEILSFLRQHLGAFKCPRTLVIIDALPRNVLGKIERGKLLQRALR